jgi:UDP-N-acetylmuramoylalanine--D-glutamate ligase
MTVQINKNTSAVVVGLGKSGLSAVRYLRSRGATVAVTDSRDAPPELAGFHALGDQIPLRIGGFDEKLLRGSNLIVVSPGVALQGRFFDLARQQGLPIVGDIELFATAARAPIAGITGTNGKSTVTTLLGNIAVRAGKRVRIGGNLGEPALDLLDASAELYVLELSSYQLDTAYSLSLAAGVILNISPDHLDRYGTVANYMASKARLFAACSTEIINADDPLLIAMPASTQRRVAFSLRANSAAEYSLQQRADGPWLQALGEPVLRCSEMKLAGLHNAANALASLALADALQLPRTAALEELRQFAGLPHRTQWVAERRGVRFMDDSKGTNIGATAAAVAGLAGPLLLIAGGDGKGQDFKPLAEALRGKVRYLFLIGRDARLLGASLQSVCKISYCESLPAAVQAAAEIAITGDTVLLSPACASLDMFRDYAHRGEVFARAVQELGR